MKHAIFFLVLFPFCALSQIPDYKNVAEIYQSMQKLKVLGSALYLAAHPDDENTRLIAWLANEKKVKVGYLSLTRGDGGQNLISHELGAELGLIRTQELLTARKVDGADQFFTRAIDFGYSKTADETLEIWNKEKILYDVVWNIRKFRPDVIVLRFPADGRGGHGHHTSSALLGLEAFDKAANPKVFPKQLDYVETWQPKRILVNSGRWWEPDISEKEKDVIAIDVGGFNPVLGQFYSEIAAKSRSQHKSQGFGSSPRYGEQLEYLRHKKGEFAETTLFEGIDLSWSRIKGGDKINKRIDKLIAEFNPAKPYASIEGIIDVKRRIKNLNDEYWKEQKLKEVNEIIAACLGLRANSFVEKAFYCPGDTPSLKINVVNPSPIPVQLNAVSVEVNNYKDELNAKLSQNKLFSHEMSFQIPQNQEFSDPYWLRNKSEKGFFEVEDPLMIGKAESENPLKLKLQFHFLDTDYDLHIPIQKQWADRVKGEQRQNIAVVPLVSLSLDKEVLLSLNNEKQRVLVSVTSMKDLQDAVLSLELPQGWNSLPLSWAVKQLKANETKVFEFEVSPLANAENGILKAVLDVEEKTFDQELSQIKHGHISSQFRLSPASAKLVNMDLKIAGNQIGYIMGSGDEVPQYLEMIGYQVVDLDIANLHIDKLNQLDAVMLGIRALNTLEWLPAKMDLLFDYVKSGGTLITQYNTTRGLLTEDIAPYFLKLSRKRVTDEYSDVKFLNPNTPVLNVPNKITQSDFRGWVQERGLYFASEWGEAFEPILSWSDKGEVPQKGSLLIAPYGKGYYVHTSVSWFRQLPAGVPGAYRLLANIISVGKNKK